MITQSDNFKCGMVASSVGRMSHEVVWKNNWLIANYFCSRLSSRSLGMISDYYNRSKYSAKITEFDIHGLLDCFIYWMNNQEEMEITPEKMILPSEAAHGILKCHEFIGYAKKGYHLTYGYSSGI